VRRVIQENSGIYEVSTVGKGFPTGKDNLNKGLEDKHVLIQEIVGRGKVKYVS
jgi:hypothetical protein